MTAGRRADYVIIGAGAAGCALAGRLSEDAGVSVILIEAGGSDHSAIYGIPAACGLASLRASTNYNVPTEPNPGLDGRTLVWAQGRVLGGSSSINGMIFTRGHSRVFDGWRERGCAGWGAADLQPYFRRLESNVRGESPAHGASGPIAVRPSAPTLPIHPAFLQAAVDSGFAMADDMTGNVVDAFGYYDVNARGARRVSAATGYLKPARRRRNLMVMTGTRALRIVMDGTRAVGVTVVGAGGSGVVHADREVLVSAGALFSPQLLMSSGIGPADHLRVHGIDVRIDSPEVGRNLQNHPFYALNYLCSQPVTAQSYVNPLRAAGAALGYCLGSGILAETLFAAGGFFRTDRSEEISDIQVILMPALLLQAGQGGVGMGGILRQPHGFLLGANLTVPKSRGTVRLTSADPKDYPRVLPNLLAAPSDMKRLRAGVEILRDMMRRPSMSRVIRSEVRPGAGVTTPQALEAEIRANAGSYYHQAGTCRMGSDTTAVVDTALRVRGAAGLRVVDASIMPVIVSAGTHATAMMIAEKAAAMIHSGE